MRNLCAMLLLVLLTFSIVDASLDTAADQSLSIPASQPIFALDFTPNGVICSVSLPDGSVVGLVNERGSFAYRQTMRKMFDWAEDVALKGRFPNWMDRTENPVTYGDLQSVLDLKPLVDTVFKAKNHALQRLKSQHIVTTLDVRPNVVISDVRFLMTSSPFPYYLGSNLGVSLSRFASEKEGLLFGHIFDSLQQVASSAGFHPIGPFNGPGGDQSGHQCAWNRSAARNDICAGMRLSTPRMWSRWYTECENPEQLVLVVHTSDVGLLFWAQESRGCQAVITQWSFHEGLKVVYLGHVGELSEEWTAAVRWNIERAAERLWFAPAQVSVVVASGEWTDAARVAFRSVVEGLGMNTAMLDGATKESEVFGVSMAAAAYGSMGLGLIHVGDLPVLSFPEEVDDLIPSGQNALAIVEHGEL
ncbi:unnamed protein product [Zymoseptoria tritici ST99CH_1A5]|uniref:Nitroreductase domain-containing protein n=3 Tax=Zymoseptoria tritici TaxID=1047171 RepID=A0A1X7S4A6_ZYMT9|nr:unnamed protein product [Zymoseptoria tritici ST99CH_3D7]SMR58940.1 unnamed protein product [Zymoseptoria tritici ST99CH_1E4]SMY28157.1 unnamed protein product [Zymoseptoria tritici ST99CH_1A5]